MRDNFLKIYLLLVVILADIYIVLPYLRPITFLNYLIVFKYLSNQKKYNIHNDFKELYTFSFIFIIYIFLIDLYQNDLQLAFSTFLSCFPIPIVFMYFAMQKNIGKLIYFFTKIFILYNGFFALLQFFGFYITAGELLANIPAIEVKSGFHTDFYNQGLRVSGASFSIIGFSLYMGFMFLYFYYNKPVFYSKKVRLFFLVFITILVMLSQTRSLIYLLPAIIIFMNIFNKSILKGIRNTILFFFAGLFVFYLSFDFLNENFPRLFLNFSEDGSVVHRIQGNIYSGYSTFILSPIIGLPIDQSYNSLEFGQKQLGLFFGDYFYEEVTYHNQLFFYFRHYGIIGLMLLLFLYRKIFILFTKNYITNDVRNFIFSAVIFQLVYSLSHNNKIFTDAYIWFYFSLCAYCLTKFKMDEKKI